jgi:hypothetical protein
MSSSIPTLTTGEMSGSAQGIKQKTAHVCMTFQKVSPYPKFPDGLQGNIPKGIQNFSQRGCLQHLSNIHPCELCTGTLCCVADMWEMHILATKASLNLQYWADIRCFFCSCLQQIRDLLCEGGHPNAACHVTPTCHKSSSSLEKTRMAFYMPSKHKIFTSWKILWNIARMKILQILVNYSFYIPLIIVAERDPVNTECSPSPDFGHCIIVLLHRSFAPRVHL